MATLKPKDFIQSVLIDELGTMINSHPYISFIIMGIGIEFLGKAIDTSLNDWNVRGRSQHDFENAIKTIPALKRYEPYLATYTLYDSLRCGLAHSIAPKNKVTLSSKEEQAHLVKSAGQINLKVEDFYQDFELACKHVINQPYPASDKMEKDFLYVPGDTFNSGTDISGGITSSSAPVSGTTYSMPPASGAPSTLPHII
jgi:hypothetical protein